MTPIIKNTRVVDEYGNEYEATYPKRAKGLVKNGRARFVDENCICLVRPPNNDLEEKYMKTNDNQSLEINNKIHRALQQNPSADVAKIVRDAVDKNADDAFGHMGKSVSETNSDPAHSDKLIATDDGKAQPDTVKSGQPVPTLTMDYVLAGIDKVLNDTEHIKSTLAALVGIPVAGPGDIANAQRADALGDIVKCRETTNQKLLALYEKMYDDLKAGQKSIQDKALDLLNSTMNNPALSSEEKELVISSLDEIRHLEPQTSLERNIPKILNIAKSIDWDAYPPQVQADIREAIKAQLSRSY